ncbi:MAG: zinc ribbon domain-containing protein [Candidatus Omnitrophica bacterium]|nr:zinc ribbon domain-containing protein [Candidatus Omnitrophota bacterium]
MPLYEYAPDDAQHSCAKCCNGFSALQSIQESSLRECPACHSRCHRVFSSFAMPKSERALLSPQNLARHGFTQYKRSGKGHYEKTAGAGPNELHA